jgi:hypothetical protein
MLYQPNSVLGTILKNTAMYFLALLLTIIKTEILAEDSELCFFYLKPEAKHVEVVFGGGRG